VRAAAVLVEINTRAGEISDDRVRRADELVTRAAGAARGSRRVTAEMQLVVTLQAAVARRLPEEGVGMELPKQVAYVIVGAGVHGLSTAWHLAKELKARGRGSGEDVIVLDKTGVAAGASGIACGVIRNNYFQPAMRKLMAHSVSVWESDPEAFAYHPVGYMQISPEVMHDDVVQIYKEQQAIGYPSTLVEGEEECREYMRNIFHDWQAENITSVLHEHRGGYANNKASIRALAAKAQAEGVRIHTGVRVTGLRMDDGAVSAVETDQGAVRCEHLVAAVGPWVRDIWKMLDLPRRSPSRVPTASSTTTARCGRTGLCRRVFWGRA
jgi:glycine/D-amino acid oxidase-like deaminating enzyme